MRLDLRSARRLRLCLSNAPGPSVGAPPAAAASVALVPVTVLAVWVGKLTLLALRLIGRRGNALPGLVVEKVFPGYLARTMASLPEGVVVVSGTNGKTTTTKMVATILGERLRVLTNDTGSNFVRGTITATVEHASWSGRLPYDVAVFELDEAWAVRFVERVAPRRTLLLNVMRDQLDRFGEIDTTAALLGKVAAATTGDLVLNRDDERIAALGAGTAARVSYYGVAPALRELFPNDEELYGGPVHISDLPATVELRGLPAPGRPAVTMHIDGADHDAVLRAEGPHNAQNVCGAAAMALTFGFPAEVALTAIAKISPAFGRGQTFTMDGRRLVLQLVKNPAGFRQSLRTVDVGGVAKPAAVVVAINDDYADGRDVSWLWDVDFTALAGGAMRRSTAGTRAADMAVRLRYDDVVVDEIEPDLEKSVRAAVAAVAPDATVVVFSTYTAMWALHGVLQRIAVPQ
jgi:UDP-N-acetylmuramyl tripeptide synthase